MLKSYMMEKIKFLIGFWKTNNLYNTGDTYSQILKQILLLYCKLCRIESPNENQSGFQVNATICKTPFVIRL